MVAEGTMKDHGQVCFSTERIIVQSAVKHEFEGLLIEAIKGLKSEEMAVTTASAEKAKSMIDEAVKDGAKFVYGGSDITNHATVTPSILTDVKKSSTISHEEAFGPTAFLTIVDTEDEAVEEANSRLGGLSAAVWTKDHERGVRLAKDLEFGQIQINNMTIFADRKYSSRCRTI